MNKINDQEEHWATHLKRCLKMNNKINEQEEHWATHLKKKRMPHLEEVVDTKAGEAAQPSVLSLGRHESRTPVVLHREFVDENLTPQTLSWSDAASKEELRQEKQVATEHSSHLIFTDLI